MASTADLRTEGLQEPVDVAKYLFDRLHQIGVRSVHGLPGDYNLVALDYLPDSGLTWVGSVNELNAGEHASIELETTRHIVLIPLKPMLRMAMPV